MKNLYHCDYCEKVYKVDLDALSCENKHRETMAHKNSFLAELCELLNRYNATICSAPYSLGYDIGVGAAAPVRCTKRAISYDSLCEVMKWQNE